MRVSAPHRGVPDVPISIRTFREAQCRVRAAGSLRCCCLASQSQPVRIRLVSPDDTRPDVAPRPQFAQGDNGTWTVNTLADPGDGTCDDTECTLREAIEAAASGDNVVFATGIQGEILLTAGQLEILRKDLSIDGDGRITVDAQHASRVFMVAAVVGTHEITIAGMTIENGTLSVDLGAGIWATQGAQLRLDNVAVAHNSTGADGGGIAVQESSTLTMINSTVNGNAAGGAEVESPIRAA